MGHQPAEVPALTNQRDRAAARTIYIFDGPASS
jgi:hypothetical protein